jgi:uncharacterized protein with NAD-binding domain and iron-sulfur cluster
MSTPKRVAILGGGIAGLSAAWGITSSPDWQDNFEVTVYQLGWRLGGKGAAGRDQSYSDRVYEHGLHVWGGFYENAFALIRECYTELGRPENAPLATWDEAFLPAPLVAWMEDLTGESGWLAWNNQFPQYTSSPGDGTAMPSLFEGVLRILDWIAQTYENGELSDDGSAALRLPEAVNHELRAVAGLVKHPLPGACTIAVIARLAHSAATRLGQDALASGEARAALSWLLSEIRSAAKQTLVTGGPNPDSKRRAAILVDLGVTEVLGMLEDGVFGNGLDVIDNVDLSDWYARHGAAPESVSSALVRGTYDFIFAYQDGNPDSPALAAGTGLRLILRLIMWYKGAVFYRMAAGMGDTVMAPLYLTLAKRGVQFEFFNIVEDISTTGDGRSIASITIGQQATVTTPPYQPLIDVNGLPSWPSVPLYDQLLEGERLQDLSIDLESPWSPWTPVETIQLIAGTDFDIVVLATSLGVLPYIAPELCLSGPWKAMIDGVQTVPTQSFQLWVDESLNELGWTAQSPVLTAYAHPFETWADMTQVLQYESWPENAAPRSLAYFCGPLLDTIPLPSFDHHDFPFQQSVAVATNAVSWITNNVCGLWPSARDSSGFNWQLLHDPDNGSGPDRFRAQFWRANISPAERYVLSVPNSTALRLKADESGYENLVLAGDWILNGLNFGCVESAVMGGLQASRAICGYPTRIVGEYDFA